MGKSKRIKCDPGSHGRLTERQKMLLEFLVLHCSNEGATTTFSFSHEKISKILGFSLKGARVHFDALVKKKAVTSSVVYHGTSGQPKGRRVRVTNVGLSLLSSFLKNEFEKIAKKNRLSEIESRLIRNMAIQELCSNGFRSPNNIPELRIDIHVGANINSFLNKVRCLRNVRSEFAHWAPDSGEVPEVLFGMESLIIIPDNIMGQQEYLYNYPLDMNGWVALANSYLGDNPPQKNKVMELCECIDKCFDQETARKNIATIKIRCGLSVFDY